MASYPETKATSMEPAPNSFPKKTRGESFDEAQNAPNDPQKRWQPTSFNTSDDYPGNASQGSDKNGDD
jgi:hypothetical protein